MTLEELRNKIDRIDKELVSNLDQRMQVVEEIARLKKEAGIPIFDEARERLLLQKIEELSLPEYAIHNVEVYKKILEESKKLQKRFMDNEV